MKKVLLILVLSVAVISLEAQSDRIYHSWGGEVILSGADMNFTGTSVSTNMRFTLFFHTQQFINFDLTTDREGFNSVFGGVGFANPIGSNGALNITLLYNFSHDDGQRSPYADPYVIRIGVSFGF